MLTGKGVKKLRMFKGYHQKEIADNMNVCQQYISKLEAAKRKINEPAFLKILTAMNITAKEWEEIKHLFTPPLPAK